jgi:O-antigen ligase
MSTTSAPNPRGGTLFSAALGWLLGLALVKLGNPVVLNHLVHRPSNLSEWVFEAWPPVYGYPLLLLVLALSWPVIRRPTVECPRYLVWLPVLWLGWQILAWWASVDRSFSGPVVVHYASVVGCYFAGLLALSRVRDLRGFWIGLLVGFTWVMLSGFDQRYGGLAASRRAIYEQADWQSFPPEYLARVASDRVFATLFYANTLAGVVLLLLPALVVAGWGLWPERLRLYRSVFAGLLVYAGISCLFWSGSKAGWLIAGVVGFVALLHLPLRKDLRLLAAGLAMLLVLAGFGLRFGDYLERGATSAVARIDYWRVAVRIVAHKPITGSGPGTFGHLYRELKPPEAEMSRVVHNDYLQQASDAGLPAGVLFTAWLTGALLVSYRRSLDHPVSWAVWLGVLAWSLQGMVEFGLLIPAVSWVGMVFLGWLVGVEHRDRQRSGASLALKS